MTRVPLDSLLASILETSLCLDVVQDFLKFLVLKSPFEAGQVIQNIQTAQEIKRPSKILITADSMLSFGPNNYKILDKQSLCSSNWNNIVPSQLLSLPKSFEKVDRQTNRRTDLGMSAFDSSAFSGHRLANDASSNLCNFCCCKRL